MRRIRPVSLAAGAAGAGLPQGRTLVLQARGVVKHVGSGRARQLILRGVDLEVGSGEMVAVLGRSGWGSRRCCTLLGGLDQPDAGAISVAGRRSPDPRSGC